LEELPFTMFGYFFGFSESHPDFFLYNNKKSSIYPFLMLPVLFIFDGFFQYFKVFPYGYITFGITAVCPVPGRATANCAYTVLERI
jgi:hypothetical protein